MMHAVSVATGLILLGYLLWDIARSGTEYRKLKESVAKGDTGARTRFYAQVLVFEWVSAFLAAAALGFDKTKLTAASLEFGRTAFGQWLESLPKNLISIAIGGVAGGIALGLIVMMSIRMRAGQSGLARLADAPAPRLRKLVPDFSELIPTTGRERLVFAAVALSAGICEEVVFRGWLLFSLHNYLGIGGTATVLFAAGAFGLVHFYQGLAGVASTTVAGLLFCTLYVATGTLLVPMVLHSLMDLRLVVLPASRPNHS